MLPQDSISTRPRKIVLVGFMGAGKSTVGPILAERLGYRFFDSDHQLQLKTGSTIPQIFAAFGEPSFRRLEAEVIAELQSHCEIVLALGGGALETESTRSLLQQSCDSCIIFLKASLDVLVDRCERQPGADERPVLRQRDKLAERFASRLEYYEQAHLTVMTEGLEPEAIAEQILSRLMIDPRSEHQDPANSPERVRA